MDAATPLLSDTDGPPVTTMAGDAQVLLVCEHASRRIPARLGALGLDETAATSHAAWDIGAEPLSLALHKRLNAPLILAGFSRLVYDLNRPQGHPNAMPARTERFDIPGNVDLDAAAKDQRLREIYKPFHHALLTHMDRTAPRAMVTIHSFTPTWHDEPRVVELGLLHTMFDDRMARAMGTAEGFVTRLNEPYSPLDPGVMHTVEEHAIDRGILNVMVEVRNDLLKTPPQIETMADTLAQMIARAMDRYGHPLSPPQSSPPTSSSPS